MRVSSNCHSLLACCSKLSVLRDCSSCLLRSRQEDDVQNVLSSQTPVSVVLEKMPSKEKIQVEQDSVDEVKADIFLKSSLKKPREMNSVQAAKGNVKWMDLLGKELVEIREFEPTDSEELENGFDSNTACMCIVQ